MAHEDLGRRQDEEIGSDRSFCVVFAVVFAVIACWPLLHREGPRWWAVLVTIAFATIGLLRPSLVAGLNRAWARFGVFLGRIVGPLALGLLFYVCLAPIGVLLRLAGKDPLRLKRDAAATTYWQPRDPPGPPPDSFNNQF